MGGFHTLPTHLAPKFRERLRIMANRLQFSKVWIAVYIFNILLSVVLLIFTAMIDRDVAIDTRLKFWVFFALDFALTIFILFEILLSLLAQSPRLFFSQWNHRVDVLVAVLCIVSLHTTHLPF